MKRTSIVAALVAMATGLAGGAVADGGTHASPHAAVFATGFNNHAG